MEKDENADDNNNNIKVEMNSSISFFLKRDSATPPRRPVAELME